jgi:rhodanese-related sulfurtransferase
VALELKKLGFTRVQPLFGGLYGWIELGYPVEERNLVASA